VQLARSCKIAKPPGRATGPQAKKKEKKMAFHYTNLGLFGEELKKYTDIDGFIPEAGDEWENFYWDAMIEWDDDSWEDFVAEAVEATLLANNSLDDWRS
jgi:hypothetical protein